MKAIAVLVLLCVAIVGLSYARRRGSARLRGRGTTSITGVLCTYTNYYRSIITQVCITKGLLI